jgi:hypothetical protein
MRKSVRIACLRVWTHSLPTTNHAQLSLTKILFTYFALGYPLRINYCISILDQTSHPRKITCKMTSLKACVYLVLLNLTPLVYFSSYLSPWPADNKFFSAYGTVLERAECTLADACRSQHRLHCTSSLMEMLPSHHGELLQYLFIFGLNLVTQRSLDLSVWVHVQ